MLDVRQLFSNVNRNLVHQTWHGVSSNIEGIGALVAQGGIVWYLHQPMASSFWHLMLDLIFGIFLALLEGERYDSFRALTFFSQVLVNLEGGDFP